MFFKTKLLLEIGNSRIDMIHMMDHITYFNFSSLPSMWNSEIVTRVSLCDRQNIRHLQMSVTTKIGIHHPMTSLPETMYSFIIFP